MIDSHQTADLAWRAPVTDEELVTLTLAHGGAASPGWWDRVHPHSLGWVTARDGSGELVGFVNVAWDGADHAFLVDTKTHPRLQRRGLGTEVVRQAVVQARNAGCEWLFVDFEPHLAPFYLGACGFRTTAAGLVHLPTLDAGARRP
ncbi:GNAT family N-acetyltransferase [Quadrisphaera oryzae]|uniref:GNAT family N-acetyltransferase n=1 Tax=Quadrisphaera TaxID=317661 RepID=UPI00351C3297